ncbi:MAG: ROK family protein [Clostridia bacterium]|nr:ROK family protein [Clostridia bacterium]
MILGFDIGGTKCAVVTAEIDESGIELLAKEKIATDLSVDPTEMIDRLITLADRLCGDKKPEAIGISCGGPLDAEKGVILGPPNLIGWNEVYIVEQIKAHFGVPVRLQNDANACALAEWKFGAGQGCDNMIFLTFGTGLGAGLILDGRLYNGTNCNAGEVGHIRLEKMGPVGYGKVGSFEGFCSGGGIAQLGYTLALEKSQQGECPAYYKPGMTCAEVTAKTVADAADAGDPTANEVYRLCGEYLGRGLSVLIDILNPQRIVLGSIFARSENLLRAPAEEIIRKEALSCTAGCCEIVAATLGERIGDYAAIATALQ